MASATKEAFGNALKQMMAIKPINKITVKDLVEICNVNRQTFYYHFDDVYDLLEWVFEVDADKVLPSFIVYDRWRENVLEFFSYLSDNRVFALNIYNSDSRLYMLKFLKSKVEACIRDFVELVTADKNIERNDFEFVVDFYSACVIGIISQWLDAGMNVPANFTKDRLLTVLENSVEDITAKFSN